MCSRNIVHWLVPGPSVWPTDRNGRRISSCLIVLCSLCKLFATIAIVQTTLIIGHRSLTELLACEVIRDRLVRDVKHRCINRLVMRPLQQAATLGITRIASLLHSVCLFVLLVFYLNNQTLLFKNK